MDSLVLTTVLGLVFVGAAFALLVALISEMISRFIGLRGEYLLRGLRTLLDSDNDFELRWRDIFRRTPGRPDPESTPMISRFVELPYIRSFADKGDMPINAGNAKLINSERRRIPSYVSGRSFARAIIDLTVPNQLGPITVEHISASISTLPNGPVKYYLDAFVNTVGNDVDKIQQGLAQWYDDQMSRVSGWYKRHIRWISLTIGTILVLTFNVNVAHIVRSLYVDQALDSQVTQALASADCETLDAQACLDKVRAEIADAPQAGFPIGWSGTDVGCGTDPCSWLEAHGLANPAESGLADVLFFLSILLGWVIMVFILLPGARFWFDLLAKMGTLRSTGPRPPITT